MLEICLPDQKCADYASKCLLLEIQFHKARMTCQHCPFFVLIMGSSLGMEVAFDLLQDPVFQMLNQTTCVCKMDRDLKQTGHLSWSFHSFCFGQKSKAIHLCCAITVSLVLGGQRHTNTEGHTEKKVKTCFLYKLIQKLFELWQNGAEWFYFV